MSSASPEYVKAASPRCSSESGSMTCSSLVQPQNARFPISRSVFGSRISSRAESSNTPRRSSNTFTPVPRTSRPSFRTTCRRREHPQKAAWEMALSAGGAKKFSKSDSWNAPTPMNSRPLPSASQTSLTALLLNALARISRTDAGTYTRSTPLPANQRSPTTTSPSGSSTSFKLVRQEEPQQPAKQRAPTLDSSGVSSSTLSCLQPKNAPSPNSWTVRGVWNSWTLVPANAPAPMNYSVLFSANSTNARWTHALNASSPISSTLSGILTLRSPLSAKHPAPSTWSPSFSSTCASYLHLLNALRQIS